MKKFSLNLNKTIYMSFGGKKLIDKLRFSNIYLPIVKGTRFLRVHINESLNWHKHFNEHFNKSLSNKRLLAIAKLYLSEKAKLTFYYVHIFSHISYSICIWGGMIAKPYLDKIYEMQKECIWYIAKLKKIVMQIFFLKD